VSRVADRANVLVSTRVVGFRGVDRTTADLLTGGDAALAFGCGPAMAPAPYDDLVALLPDASQARVEHLDAGEVTALVDGVALSSAASKRPALSPYVAGLEYGDQAATVPVTRGEVLITAQGGTRIGSFETGGSVPPPIDARATWGDDLAVSWSASGAEPAATTDEVVLTIAPEHANGAIVCRAADRGELHVRADLLARIAGISNGAPVTVVIDRVRRSSFAGPGLADASLEVVARDVVTASAQ
jgi:hypothetical protein